MEAILIKIIIFELFVIFMLFLRELDIPIRIYEELYTNPITRKLLKVFGDVLYMIGGSIVAAVIFAYIIEVEKVFYFSAFIVGIIFVILGAYLRK